MNVTTHGLQSFSRVTRRTSEDVPNLFLDAIPKELLDNLVKFFSRLPKARNWEVHVALEDITGLSGISGELGRLFRTRFRTLCVSKTRDCYDENLYYGWKLRSEPHLWTNDIWKARQYVLAAGGDSLETLVIGIGMYMHMDAGPRATATLALVDDFRRYCPNVISLSIDETRSTWVNRFSGQLETLEVTSRYRNVLDIHPTPMLRALTLDTGSDYFDLSFSRCAIGRLETLVIFGGTIPNNQYDDIRRYCPNLKRISMQGRTNLETNKVSRFLSSYGEQLEYAYLRDMSERQIFRVANACPNAQFHLQDYSNGVTAASLYVLGNRLEEITVSGFYMEDRHHSEWTNAWDECKNLRKLTVSNCNLQRVQAMFAKPKDHLKVLSIDMQMVADGDTMKKLMDICANGTNCVEELRYGGQPFYRNTADKFFEKNRRSLTSIVVREKFVDGDVRLNALLDSLFKLPVLEQLNLDCNIPQSTLRLLEKRGIHWKRGNFAWQ